MEIEAVTGIVMLLAVGCIFYGPWQWVCTDLARQIAFEKRDAVFDMALNGKLSFDSDEYKRIRRALEKSIRHAHDLTLPNFVYVMFAYKIYRKLPKTELFSALERIEDEAVREEVRKHVMQSFAYMFVFTFLKSAVGVLVIIPVFAVLVFAKNATAWLPRFSRLLQAEAEAVENMKSTA